MTDVHSREVRSFNMSRIRSKDTKPELLVRKYLFSKGFRYRIHDKRLPGKPDIVLKRYKTIILIHGCFWHGHENCKYFVLPKTRSEWWSNKINANKEKDKKSIEALSKTWRVIIVYECDLKSPKSKETLTRIEQLLKMTQS